MTALGSFSLLTPREINFCSIPCSATCFGSPSAFFILYWMIRSSRCWCRICAMVVPVCSGAFPLLSFNVVDKVGVMACFSNWPSPTVFRSWFTIAFAFDRVMTLVTTSGWISALSFSSLSSSRWNNYPSCFSLIVQSVIVWSSVDDGYLECKSTLERHFPFLFLIVTMLYIDSTSIIHRSNRVFCDFSLWTWRKVQLSVSTSNSLPRRYARRFVIAHTMAKA